MALQAMGQCAQHVRGLQHIAALCCTPPHRPTEDWGDVKDACNRVCAHERGAGPCIQARQRVP